MKKALAMALGAMLVAGSAVPAAAKSQIDFSGLYRVHFLNNWNQGYDTKEEKTNDGAYFVNRLQMDFAFHATDEVSVYWRLRGPSGGRWGDTDGDTKLQSRWHYGEIKQDWGMVSIGRLKDAYTDLGLASLGYAPDGADGNGIFTNVLPFDFDDATDGIRYANRWDNGFQLAAAFLRFTALEKTNINEAGTATVGTGESENLDLFVLEPAFFWDGGGASLGLHYLRDHTGETDDGAFTTVGTAPALKMFAINPAISHSWGDFSTHFEGYAAWGKADGFDAAINNDITSVKASGYAFYLDLDYNYGPGNVNLAGWWAQGPSLNRDDYEGKAEIDAKGMVDFRAFAPLIVAYSANANGRNYGGADNAIAVANEIAFAEAGLGDVGLNPNANHWAIDLNGAHAFTDDLTLTYAVAYLALNKTAPGLKKGIGVETDLGLNIQLLDNLQFSTTFGYLFAGDAFKQDIGEPTEKKAADAYNWYNTLTFTF